MNLAQLQTSIQAKGYGTDTAAYQVIALNSVYRDICGMDRWPFLEKQDTSITLTVNQPAYPIAGITDFLHFDAVRIEVPGWVQGMPSPEAHDLEYKEPQELRTLENVDRDNGTPFYWSFIDQAIRVYPAPDQSYIARIDYIRQPPDLVNSTDTPVIPVIYHDVLVWGAVAEIAYRERDWLGRNFALQEMQGRLKHMQEEYLMRQRQTASHVKESGYWNNRRPSPFGHVGW